MNEENKNNTNLGIRVANAIRECGLKQYEVAEKLNYTPTYLSNIVNGRRPVTPEFAEKLCKLLNCVHYKQAVNVSIPFEELTDSEREEAIEDGYSSRDEVPSYYEIGFYDPRYFLGKIGSQNAELWDNTKQAAENGFSFFVNELLRNFGYELESSPSYPFSLFFMSPQEMEQRITNYIGRPCTTDFLGADNFQFFLKEDYLKIKDIKTSKCITISKLDFLIWMNELCQSINRKLQLAFMKNNILSMPQLKKQPLQIIQESEIQELARKEAEKRMNIRKSQLEYDKQHFSNS